MHGHNDPDKFYDEIIMPYKGELEEWFVANNSICNYFLLIILTIIVIFSSRVSIVWQFIKKLPKPKDELVDYLS